MKKIILSIALITISIAAYASDVPSSLPYQGNLTDASGLPVNADHPIEVRLYDSLIAGLGSGVDNSHVIYAERHDAVRIENGIFRISIGDGTSLDPRWTALPVNDLLAKENVYLELWIDGERLSPRQRVGSTTSVIRSKRTKYTDELTHLPEISPSMIPSYDANKITSGTFPVTQIPNMSTSKISGPLQVSNIPTLPTSKFSTIGTINAARFNNLDASKITTGIVESSFLPATLLNWDELAIIAGSINSDQMLTIPEGFTQDECNWVLSPSQTLGAVEGIDQLHVTIDGLMVVRCWIDQNEGPSPSEEIEPCSVNYLMVCSKGG